MIYLMINIIHLNPFTESIDLHSNTGGNLSSTTYTIPLRNADGMFLDDTDNEFLVILSECKMS